MNSNDRLILTRVILAIIVLASGAAFGIWINPKGAFEWLTGAITAAVLIRLAIPPEHY